MNKINKQIYNFTNDTISSDIIGKQCCFKNCKEKVEVVLSVNSVIKGLKVEKLYPVCKKHKEEILNNNQ